jgi:hypothetical protein
LSDIVRTIAAWAPRLVGALVWLVIGWVVARLAQFILAGLLRRLGLDRLTERAGADRVLADAGLESSASKLIARLVYWLVLLVFILAATESLGLSRVVDTLGGLVGYLPNVLAAALILLLGGLLARFVGDAVGGVASQASVRAGPMLRQVVRYALFIFVAILALEQLGRMVSIGSVKTVIETEGGLISLPNSVLTNEEVTIVKESAESG